MDIDNIMEELRPISKQEEKLLNSLGHKKYRDSLSLFRAEGSKVIESLLPHFTLEWLLMPHLHDARIIPSIPLSRLRTAPSDRYRRLSLLESPGDMIAVFHKPLPSPSPSGIQGLTVALDRIQNPGNLGTIIRLCDWLGIRTLLLGEGCVDLFNPKVVQATAGALGALTIREQVSLERLLPGLSCPIIGTAIDGVDMTRLSPPEGDALVLFGNEGHGMSDTLKALCTDLIRIPSAPETVSESLNVSMSAAIILSHITLS